MNINFLSDYLLSFTLIETFEERLNFKKEGIAQLKTYLANDEQLRKLRNLRAYVLLFSNKKVEAFEIL